LCVLGIFLFTTASRTALEPTQPPIQWVQGALSPKVERPGRETNHSSPSSAEVKNAWSYTSTLQYVFMEWCLVKHRHNFTFYPLLTPWNRVPLEKLIVTHLVQKFPAFYVTRWFITVSTRARLWPLCWARCIHFTSYHSVSLRSFEYVLPICAYVFRVVFSRHILLTEHSRKWGYI
jgi:hypothetical protein